MDEPVDPPRIRPVEVLITLGLPDALIATLREVSSRLRITVHPARKAEDVPAELWLRAEVLYTDRVLPNPDLAPDLRWIQFHYAGIDFAAESPWLKNPEIIATSLSGAAASQVAEYALGMMLALGHHLPELAANQARAEWPRDRWDRYLPKELRDSTVGIIGYGSIGREIARLLFPCGATVLAVKHEVRQPVDMGYIPEGLGDPRGEYFHRLYPYQALRSMLKECDFIVVAAPLTPQTRGLVGANEFAVMKPTAYLVDLARGGIVDQPALISSLQEHRLAGAALDVFPEEPLPPSNPLWRMPNVIITPHISGISPRYNERAMALFAVNLSRYLAGQTLYNRFEPQKGY
jgi:phosphoglycerate dehydrogenase-like enzyme